jgi:hypothetical protein
VFTLCFALYWGTLAPTITWQHDGYDGGDLITAAYTLGIPHPTGYPTYMLLGHFMTRLPLGDVAYRMNLLSALCAALAVALCYQTAVALLEPADHARLAALGAALVLATSRIFWSQAVITEVYGLNALLFCGTLYLALRSLAHLARRSEPADHRYLRALLAALAVLYGLSLGNHLTMLFSAPLLLYVSVVLWRRRALNAGHWAALLGFFLLGLAVYVYLPLRAGKEPLLNWGDPGTPSGVWWVISGGIYRQFALSLPPALWAQRILAWVGLLRQQFGLAGAALGLLGAWWQSRRSVRTFTLLSGTAVLYSVYAIGYNTTDSYVYLLPVYCIYALWIAQGAQCALTAIASQRPAWRRPLWALACMALLALPLNALRENLPAVDLHADHTAYDYGTQALSQVPDRCMVISASDAHTFALWYFSRVVMPRHQVAVIDRDLLGYAWYVAGLRRAYPWLQWPDAPLGSPDALDRLVQANQSTVSVFWADVDAESQARYRLTPQGVLFRALAP